LEVANLITPPAPPAAPRRIMPDLAGGTHAHTHSVHSALVSLSALGVAQHQVTVKRTGREAVENGQVVRQHPAPGTPLTGSSEIVLEIAGLGFNHSLPVGMWDSGGEEAMGTSEILEHFDDPLEKLKHWLHEGAPLFRIAPEDTAACARWLALFGVDARDWPRPMWYRLASMIAAIPRLSCSEEGLTTVLHVLLDPCARLQATPRSLCCPRPRYPALASSPRASA